MGVSAYSRVVLGYRVPLSAQKKLVPTRGCRHELSSADAAFCSKCGKPAWNKKEYNILGEPEHVDENFDIFLANAQGECYYVGLMAEDHFSEEDVASWDIPAIRDELDQALHQEGIDPNACQFGLHLAILYS